MDEKPVVIVGAGVSGLTLALLLSKTGKRIVLLEKLSPFSMNERATLHVTITEKGVQTLQDLGVKEAIWWHAIALQSRTLHMAFASEKREKRETLFSLPRHILIYALYEELKKCKNLEILFDQEIQELDKRGPSITTYSRLSGKKRVLQASLVVGADGSYSKVRELLFKGEIYGKFVDFLVHRSTWFYKSFTLSASDRQKLKLDSETLHIFPQKEAFLAAIPNKDGSLSVLYCKKPLDPYDTTSGYAHEYMSKQFRKHFPYLSELSSKGFFCFSPIQRLASFSLSRVQYKNKVILMGDAAHSLFPFYGDGIDAALASAKAIAKQQQGLPFKRLKHFSSTKAYEFSLILSHSNRSSFPSPITPLYN